MKTLKIIVITLVIIVILVATALFLIGYFREKPAGILVDTHPVASVYINGTLVGKTPYKGVYKSGDTTLKLVPDTSAKDLLPFETRLSLASGIETLVRREFGASEDASSGDIVTFDRLPAKETSLVVVTTPENAQVSLDGIPRGFAPYKSSTISPAEHQITIRSSGFNDRVMTLKVISGYRLSVFAKLSKVDHALLPLPSPAPSTIKTYVEILKTPTGFLRVRTEPGTKGEEIAEVKPGEKYLLLDEDTSTGWYKIQYQAPAPGLPKGIQGWISSQYAKKVDEAGNDIPLNASSSAINI